MNISLLSGIGISVIVLLLFASCHSSDKFKEGISEKKVKTIMVPDFPSGDVDFQEFIDRIEIVPLETNQASLFRSVFNLIHQNGRIYILDRFMVELFVFSEGGKFLFKLNKRGKGPEEYLNMPDFEVNDQGDLYILSYKKILIYDSLMRLKKTVSLSSLMDNYSLNPTSFALAFDNGYYLYVGPFGLKELEPDRYSIYKVDAEGNFRGEVFFPLRNNDAEHPRFFKLVGDQAYIFTPIIGNDTIYKFTADKVFPEYFLDYGERRLPPELYTGFHLGRKRMEAQETTDFVVSTSGVIETSKFLRFIYQARDNQFEVVYSKVSGNFFGFSLFGEPRARNYFPIVRSGVERSFYGHIDSHLLIASKKSGEFRRKFGYLENYDDLEAAIDKLHENDNPAIMIVTYKDF